MIRAVLDTTIVTSAVRSSKGLASVILKVVLQGKLSLLMDIRLAHEYREVAMRPEHVSKSDLTVAEIKGLIARLEAIAIPVEVRWRYRPISIDPGDDLVLELAINGAADLIISENVRHLREPARQFGITVVDARTFIMILRKAGIHADSI